MIYHAPSGQLRALSEQGVAAGKATVDFFEQKGLNKIPTGPNAELSFTVPGVLDAFISLLETYGTKTLGEAIEPAIDYAQRGFPMYGYMRTHLQSSEAVEQFRRYPPGGMEVFYLAAHPTRSAQLLVQEQLARTMKKMVQAEGDAAGHRLDGIRAARETIYRGDIARTIIQCSDRVGGLLDSGGPGQLPGQVRRAHKDHVTWDTKSAASLRGPRVRCCCKR